MELSRRDALAALASAGIAVGGAAALSEDSDPQSTDGSETDDWPVGPDAAVAALTAVAEVVYPSEVSNVEEFVRTYAGTRLDRRPAYGRGLAATVADLDGYVAVHTDAERFAALDTATRETVLRRLAVDTADPDPEGTVSGRVRYYLVNDALFALYASPTGGELVGIENPQGHPGGLTYDREAE